MQGILSVILGEESDRLRAAKMAAKMKAECRIADWSSTLSPPRLAIILKLDTSELRRRAIVGEFNALGLEVIEHRS